LEMVGFDCEMACGEGQACELGWGRDGGKDQRPVRGPLTVCYGTGFWCIIDTDFSLFEIYTNYYICLSYITFSYYYYFKWLQKFVE